MKTRKPKHGSRSTTPEIVITAETDDQKSYAAPGDVTINMQPNTTQGIKNALNNSIIVSQSNQKKKKPAASTATITISIHSNTIDINCKGHLYGKRETRPSITACIDKNKTKEGYHEEMGETALDLFNQIIKGEEENILFKSVNISTSSWKWKKCLTYTLPLDDKKNKNSASPITVTPEEVRIQITALKEKFREMHEKDHPELQAVAAQPEMSPEAEIEQSTGRTCSIQ